MGAAATARRFVVQRRVRSLVIVLFAPFVQIKLSKPLYALGVHSAVFCLPAIIRRIVAPILAQRIRNVVRHLRFFEYLRNLLFRVFFAYLAHLFCLPFLQINLPIASLSCFSGTQHDIPQLSCERIPVKQEEPDILCTRLIWLAYANPRSTRPAGNWLTPIMLPKSFLRFAQKLLCSDMKNKRGASFFRNLRLIRLAMN